MSFEVLGMFLPEWASLKLVILVVANRSIAPPVSRIVRHELHRIFCSKETMNDA